MALCHNCSEVTNQYVGNGVQRDFEITFEYEKTENVEVAFYDEVEGAWYNVPSDQWFFLNATTIRFNEPPAAGQKILIYRCTDLTPLPAEFYPGTAIKAQDLNDNFFVLQSAIEEARCAIQRAEDSIDDKYWSKGPDTITKEEQQTGVAETQIDENHIFSAGGAAARHDSYVQDEIPDPVPYEQQGKIWNDTDDLQNFFWDKDAQAWVSFTQSGPPGPQGNYGPPGKLIIGDSPPTEYPAVGDNAARPLESGDMWWDSNHTLLFVYYVDNTGPQWVSVSKAGPVGPVGPPGNNTRYRGIWTDPIGIPPNANSGDVWLWNGGDGVTLDNVQWGDANQEVVNNGDQIIYSSNSFDVIPAIPNGVADIQAGNGIAVDSTDPNSPIVSTTFFIEKGGNGMPYDVSLLSPLP